MIEVSAGLIVLLLLKQRESCRISDLVAIKRRVENEVPSVFVSVDRKGVLAYVQNYPEFATWGRENVIAKSEQWNSRDVEIGVNFEKIGVSEEVYSIVVNAVNDFCAV